MTSELFRREALFSSRDTRFGDYLFHQPLTVRVMAAGVALIFLSFITFAALVQMKQTALVRGYLAPVAGEIKIYSDRQGVFREIHVGEHQRVQKNAVLATVLVNRFDERGRQASVNLLGHTDEQIAQLQARMDLLKERERIVEKQLRTRIDGIGAELALLNEEHDLILKRLALAEQEYKSSATLLTRRSISSREHNQSASVWYSLLQMSATTRLNMEAKSLAILETRQQLNLQSLALKEELLSLQGNITQLLAQHDELSSQGLFTITAPADGLISNLVSRAGDTADPRIPFATLLPLDSGLEALLYLPSRAVGEVMVGQVMMLSYDAYPYQIHGTFAATITTISTAIMDPREFLIPLELNEPVYLVRARIEQHEVNDTPLRPGLQFSAEIITGSESLLQRMISPLMSLGRKL